MILSTILSLVSSAAAFSLPQAPGYAFVQCSGPDGSFTNEIWTSDDLSQMALVGPTGTGHINFKTVTHDRIIPVLNIYGDKTYVSGVNGAGSPYVFGQWEIDTFRYSVNPASGLPPFPSDGQICGVIHDPTDNLQWDLYACNNSQPSFNGGGYDCRAYYYVIDNPRSNN
ncbi:hypothetical protein HK103_005804 [Boothiomyces macroporosus]|uniref:C-type lectin domain-containing protein n=1 Tax=Boothiomyces macroporosus TaxID=261099 RepID=A0AAD5UFD0_9FUNG|nr:hypothetical protein HK103_005804 [Boothiomyces macroporosus]